MPVLAIDLGTSNVKAAVVARDGSLLGTGSQSVETLLTDEGAAEQDADATWEAVLSACEEALSAVDDRSAVEGIACASQYSSMVPVDAEGRTTANMVLWMDKRGTPERLEALNGGRRLRPNPFQLIRWLQIHAIPPLDSGADSLSHMRWLKLARPDDYARTSTMLEPMDFVTMRMTGRHVANRCSAFSMLLTDNRRGRSGYHPTLVQWSGLDREKLPEIVAVDEPLGPLVPDVAARLGLPTSTVVFPGINDTQAGGVGAGAFTGNHVGISIGTTGVCITHVDFKRTDVRNSIATMPCPIKDRNFVMAEAGTSGKAVEYFLEKLVFATDSFGGHTLSEKFEALERAIARTEPGSHGLMFLPWLTGSITPAEDAQVRGGFLNISLQTTREEMARSILEGVALNLRWVLERVERFAKRQTSHVVFYGGGALSPVWSQILANVLKVPIHQVQEPQYAVSRGIALLGFHRLGAITVEELGEATPIAAVYEPDRALTPRYDAMFDVFVRIFRKNRGVFRSLNAGR